MIGVRDENDAAVELTPVGAVEGEEGRLRQICAGGVAPHVPFGVQVVPSATETGCVYYVLVIPPSPLRPHAVRKGIDFRYPRRDGSSKRWLAEAEIAAMYRDRFRMVEDQLGRIDAIAEEGIAQMDLRSDYAYLTVALMPTTPGAMSMGLARVRRVEEWAVDPPGTFAWRGFFGSRPIGRAGIRRVRLGSLASETRPISGYAELHTDGAGFACEQVGRASREHGEGPTVIEIGNSGLLWELGRSLRLLGRHAVENTGAWGDAIVIARLFGLGMQLVYPVHGGAFAEPWNHEPISDPIAARHTVPLESLAGSDQELLVSTRLIATDLFNAFGSPEVQQIDEYGRIRIRYVREQKRLREFAEAYGVEISEETIPGS